MELEVKAFEIPTSIEFNYEELKGELIKKTETYTNLVYTEEQIKEAKQDRASLNKLKTALNDERIRREKEYMKPFTDFKGKINEIIGIIEKPINAIDTQVKAYEEEQKAQKKARLKEAFESKNEYDFLTFDKVFNAKWLNASVSESSVLTEIDTIILNTKIDLETLSKLPNFAFEATEEYKQSLDVNRAINEGVRLAEIQKRKAEAEERARIEAERKAKEETERKAEILKAPLPYEDTEEEKTPEIKEPSMWLTFSANLTKTQAVLLKQFFEENGIEFKAV